MQAKDIEKYLEQLGQELASRGIQRPIRILLIGGAYMLLLANALRPTDDVDFFWLEDENPLPPEVRVVSECVQIVSKKNLVDPHWFNYLTQALMNDKIRIPDNWLWKQHGPLCIHMPQPSISLHSRYWREEKKTLKIVNYYCQWQTLQHVNKHNNTLIVTFYLMS